jgi:5-methylcytosine-specific restriction endonuclease McrA
MKFCYRCKVKKLLTEFHKHKRMVDGHSNYCKSCTKEYKKGYYLRNADHIKAKVAKRRAENIEVDREHARLWARQHREEARVRARKWAADHPERVLENRRRYRKERPDVWRKNNAIRRARKKGAKVVEAVDFETILTRDKSICWICGKQVNPEELSFDHVIPLSKGGEHSTRNIRVTHLFCNYSKHDRLVEHQIYLL